MQRKPIATIVWPLCATLPGAAIWFPLCGIYECSNTAWIVWSTTIGGFAVVMLILGLWFDGYLASRS